MNVQDIYEIVFLGPHSGTLQFYFQVTQSRYCANNTVYKLECDQFIKNKMSNYNIHN